jgi:antitoxin MazE
MTTLTKIGNSQGVRIPKPLIQQAHLENVSLELEVLENGLLIKPINNTSRDTWKKNIEQIMLNNEKSQDEALLEDLLNDNDLEDWQW